MSVVCIDPVLASGKYAIAKFDNGSLIEFFFATQDDVGKILRSRPEYVVCFDSSKLLDNFGNEIKPWCVRTLYGLTGLKIDNLNLLAKQVLGHAAVKYFNLYEKMKSHLSSYRVVGIPVERYEVDKLFPNSLLASFYAEKCSIINALFEKMSDLDVRQFYSSFYSTVYNLHDICKIGIAIDERELNSFENHHTSAIRRNISNGVLRLRLNPVGAKTGRITCKKDTANIFALPREMRKILRARDGYEMVQYDFKAFQPRIAIACADDEKLRGECSTVRDIYSLMPGEREANKLEFLEWIFAKEFHSRFTERFQAIVDLRSRLYKQAWTDGKITNKFGRVLSYHGEMMNVVFQNYITSNEADAVFGVIDTLKKFLKGKKSHILFPFHDAIVCEIHESERGLVEQIRELIESFYVSEKLRFFFPVEVKKGPNFGSLFSP